MFNIRIINSVIILVSLLFFTSCENTDTTKYTYNQPQTTEKNADVSGIEARFINSYNCDQIIDKVYFKICYDYTYKAAKSVAYTLEGDLVNEKNIQERPKFYPESAIYDPYKAYDSDYVHSGYDRGHLAPDAAFDWSQESLEATYSLANIIPQDETVNREQWEKAEEHARKEAVILGEVKVVNVVIYPKNPKKIGKDQISVSKGFYKIMYNKLKNYQECFYYENNATLNKNNLYGNRVDCKVIVTN